MTPEPTIYLVDDDPVVLKSLRWLVGSAYRNIESFSSGIEFLERYDSLGHGCVILDMRMPEMNGLEVQASLAARGATVPVIIMTGHADIPVCTKSFRAGAFEFAVKPANAAFLLERIGQALAEDVDRHRLRVQGVETAARLVELTQREKEVMGLLVAGLSLKKIAQEFRISIQTVAKHRAKVLRKLGLNSDVELVHSAIQLASSQPSLSANWPLQSVGGSTHPRSARGSAECFTEPAARALAIKPSASESGT